MALVPVPGSELTGLPATFEGDDLRLRALVADLDGRHVVRDTIVGAVHDERAAAALGRELALGLVAAGAREILERVRQTGAGAVNTTG